MLFIITYATVLKFFTYDTFNSASFQPPLENLATVEETVVREKVSFHKVDGHFLSFLIEEIVNYKNFFRMKK